jgi:hypothetical protein
MVITEKVQDGMQSVPVQHLHSVYKSCVTFHKEIHNTKLLLLWRNNYRDRAYSFQSRYCPILLLCSNTVLSLLWISDGSSVYTNLFYREVPETYSRKCRKKHCDILQGTLKPGREAQIRVYGEISNLACKLCDKVCHLITYFAFWAYFCNFHGTYTCIFCQF